MNIQDVPIEKLLIHQPPMRLIDRATGATENSLECEIEIRRDNIFVTPTGVPAFVAVELMAQAIAAWDGWKRFRHNEPPQAGYLVGTRVLKLNCDAFSVGQVLKIEVTLVWESDKLLQFRCFTRDKHTDAQLASATINIYSPGDMDSGRQSLGGDI